MPVKKAEQKRAQSRRGQIQAMGSGKQAEARRFRADGKIKKVFHVPDSMLQSIIFMQFDA